MEDPYKAEVIIRAYELWEETGKPEGSGPGVLPSGRAGARNEGKAGPSQKPDNS